MPIRTYVQREVRTIGPDATAREAAHQMEQANVGCLIVMRGDEPEGVLTDRDIALKVLCECLDPGSVRVRELISGNPARQALAAGGLHPRASARRLCLTW